TAASCRSRSSCCVAAASPRSRWDRIHRESRSRWRRCGRSSRSCAGDVTALRTGGMDRALVRAWFERERCSAILRTGLSEAVAPALDAAISGGFRIVEVTLTTPNAFTHIEAFARNAELLVGAGTVLTVRDAESAIRAGARFLVSPVTDTEVI